MGSYKKYIAIPFLVAAFAWIVELQKNEFQLDQRGPSSAANGYFEFIVLPSPYVIDWSSPLKLLLSYRVSQWISDHLYKKSHPHSMGHGVAHFHCTDSNGKNHNIYSGITGQNLDEVDVQNIEEYQLGLKTIFMAYDDGYIQSSNEVRYNIGGFVGRKEKPVGKGIHTSKQISSRFMRWPIQNAKQCDDVLEYYHAFHDISNTHQPQEETSATLPYVDKKTYSQFLSSKEKNVELALQQLGDADELTVSQIEIDLLKKMVSEYFEVHGSTLKNKGKSSDNTDVIPKEPDPKKLWFGLTLKPYDLFEVWKAEKQKPTGHPAYLGGGCTSFVVGFLKVLGVYDKQFDDFWMVRLNVHSPLIGNDDVKVKKADFYNDFLSFNLFDRYFYGYRGTRWIGLGVNEPQKGVPSYYLEFWDPEKIWKFMDTVSACSTEGSSSRELRNTSPYHFHKCEGPIKDWYISKTKQDKLDFTAVPFVENHPLLKKNIYHCKKTVVHHDEELKTLSKLGADYKFEDCKDSKPVYGISVSK